MRKFIGSKFPIIVCFSFFSQSVAFPGRVLKLKTRFPIGEIVSRRVRFEARENVWKSIDSSHFPVFEGKIKTERERAWLLGNSCNLEIVKNSVISFEQVNQVHVTQGRVNFRIPSSKEMVIKVGSLTVTKPRVQQASKGTTIVPTKNEDTVGSVTLHANGSVTIKNLQGSLSILDQDHVVVAALSSKESITIPATMASEILQDDGASREVRRVKG
jgi:hypothetical protein